MLKTSIKYLSSPDRTLFLVFFFFLSAPGLPPPASLASLPPNASRTTRFLARPISRSEEPPRDDERERDRDPAELLEPDRERGRDLRAGDRDLDLK